ncbi:MAG: hypothetical protein GWP05_09210 [Anaerolineaceae bacterium]|nr:hypothetical protein [Anaerolineaceae bacterium]
MTRPAKWQLEIREVRPAGQDYCWLHLAAPPEWDSRPGQFINIRCDGPQEQEVAGVVAWDGDHPPQDVRGAEIKGARPLIRRPLSISSLRSGSDGRREIVLLMRIVGVGSRLLGRKRAGDILDVIGPLGNGFDLDVPGDRAFLIGGGCGIAPLVGLANRLAEAGQEVVVFYGDRAASLIPLTVPQQAGPTVDKAAVVRGVAEFACGGGEGVGLVAATEDGSLGYKGLVTDALAAYGAEFGWENASVLACGPEVMMAAVADLAAANGVRRCQVSLENYMGCAIGVCLSCAVRIRADNDEGWTYKLVCKDGPVFEAAEVIFESKWPVRQTHGKEGCKK